jgi:hypothetical protein
MRKYRLTVMGLLAVALFLNTCAGVRAFNRDGSQAGRQQRTRQLAQSPSSSEALFIEEQVLDELAIPSLETEPISSEAYLQTDVTLSAPHSTTSWDSRDPARSRFELPLLYLHRGRAAATESDRTLGITIADLPGGGEVQLELRSRHVDISTGDYHRQVKRIVLPGRACTVADPCKAQWVLDPIRMRSDFYYLRVKDAAGKILWEKMYPDRPDLVALDTWDVPLGRHTVRVTYASLFPFARGKNDLANRLAPDAVMDFIEGQFVPIIKETWQTQFDVWGFGQPLHPLWDADNLVEIFITAPPYALFGGTGTYHRPTHNGGQPYPQRRIWWYASNDAFQAYATLVDAYRAVFAHEFFHLAQWNVTLNARKTPSADRLANRWRNVFLEGQGKFAPSVQHPETEIGHRDSAHTENSRSEYTSAANHFLTQRLNSSYSEMEADSTDKYDAALYWRFLYERYGDMAIVRAALEEMVRHQETARGYDVDIVAGMPLVMDRAFQRVHGPFQGFEESLTAFAQANYALRLENGRCAEADFAACSGRYFDPEHKYVAPPLEAKLTCAGAPLTYSGAVPASFGMDFIELSLVPAAQGQALTVKFQGRGEFARFSVQVWRLGSGERQALALTPQPETVLLGPGGAYTYTLTGLDTTKSERLALIIVRLDAAESMDPAGEYSIMLHSPEELKTEETQERYG